MNLNTDLSGLKGQNLIIYLFIKAAPSAHIFLLMTERMDLLLDRITILEHENSIMFYVDMSNFDKLCQHGPQGYCAHILKCIILSHFTLSLPYQEICKYFFTSADDQMLGHII